MSGSVRKVCKALICLTILMALSFVVLAVGGPKLELIGLSLFSQHENHKLSSFVGAGYTVALGESLVGTVRLCNGGEPIPSSAAGTEIVIYLDLVDTKVGSQDAWNGWDLLHTIQTGESTTQRGILRIMLDESLINHFNRQPCLDFPFELEIENSAFDSSPIYTDILRSTLVEPAAWVGGDIWRSDTVRLSVTPSAMQIANVAFYTASAYFASSAGTSTQAYAQMSKGLFTMDLAEFALEITSGDLKGAELPLFNVLVGLCEAFAGGAPYVAEAGYATFLLSLLETGSDLSKIIAFDIALASALIRENLDAIVSVVWSMRKPEDLILALAQDYFTLAVAVEVRAITESNVIPLLQAGALSLQEAFQHGLIDAMTAAENGLITLANIWELTFGGLISPEISALIIEFLSSGAESTTSEQVPVAEPVGCSVPEQVKGVRAGTGEEDEIDIRWISDPSATSYAVLRSTRRTGPYVEIGSTSGSQYQDEHLPSGTSFWYKVQACNDCACSSLSAPNEGSTAGACSVPGEPGNLAATDGTYSDRIEVTWNSVSGATSYDVYRANSSGGTYTKQDTTTGTSYTESGPALGVHYWYKVQARNECGGSVFSSPDEGWAEEACDAPAQIVDVSVAPNGGSHGSCASFSGQYVDGALSGSNARYELWKSVDGGAWERVAYDTANGTYFGVGDSTSCSGSRSYKLRACLPCGACGPWSAVYGPYTSP